MKAMSFPALAVVAFGIALSPRLYAAAPFETLLQKVPEGANAIVLVNVATAPVPKVPSTA